MRLAVEGYSVTAQALVGNLRRAGFVVNQGRPLYRVRVTEDPDAGRVTLDTIEGPLEALAIRYLAPKTYAGGVWVQRAGGNQSDTELHVTLPPHEADREAVEIGLVQVFGALGQVPTRIPDAPLVRPPVWTRAWRWIVGGAIAVVFLTAAQTSAQQQGPTGAGGAASTASACNILSAASTNPTSCKGSAGNVYGYEVFNTTTTVYYLRLYDTASAPTCSSATGFIRTVPVPPAAAAGAVGGVISNQGVAVNYATGIGYCLTGGSSSTDNTNAAVGLFGEIRYK